ncbi:Bone morphogenetic protein 2, partial [Halocaridina rubra]
RAIFRGCGSQSVSFALAEKDSDIPSYIFLQSAQLHLEILSLKLSRKRKLRKGPKKPNSTKGNRRNRRPPSMELSLTLLEDGSERLIKANITIGGEAIFDVTSFVQGMTSSGRQTDMTVLIDLNASSVLRRRTKRLCRRIRWDASLFLTWKEKNPCFDPSVNPQDEDNLTQDIPLLEDGSHSATRSKRNQKTDLNSMKGCYLSESFVDFIDIGWDSWVIAPSGYNAGVCSGQCTYPYPYHQQPTSHALILSLLQEMKGKGTGACCVPRQYKPMYMLYRNRENNIILKEHPNMIATNCGCQ